MTPPPDFSKIPHFPVFFCRRPLSYWCTSQKELFLVPNFEGVQNLVHLRDALFPLGPLEDDQHLARVLDQRPHELLPALLQVLVPEPWLKPVRPCKKSWWNVLGGIDEDNYIIFQCTQWIFIQIENM